MFGIGQGALPHTADKFTVTKFRTRDILFYYNGYITNQNILKISYEYNVFNTDMFKSVKKQPSFRNKSKISTNAFRFRW